MARRAGSSSRKRADMPYVTLDQVLEPYKSKDKTVPDKIFGKTTADDEALALITVFGMRNLDVDSETGQDEAGRRGHTEPPEGSPPTPPRSPSAALDDPNATGLQRSNSINVTIEPARLDGDRPRSERAAHVSDDLTSHVTQERVLPPSTMSFPEPGQVVRTLPTPLAKDDLEPSEWMHDVDGEVEEGDDGIDWSGEARSTQTQAVDRNLAALDHSAEAEEDEPNIDVPSARRPRKIKDPLAFSDHVPSQGSSRRDSSAPIAEDGNDDEAEAMESGRIGSADPDEAVEEDADDDGLSEYEWSHRALARHYSQDGGSSEDDAEDVERQSSPIQPGSPLRGGRSQDSAHDRSFSASQQSTQDRSLSRYSRVRGRNEVLVENSDETKPKHSPDGPRTTPPDKPPPTRGSTGNVANGTGRVGSGSGAGSSAQQFVSSPTSSGALAYLNPMNVVRAVTRVVKGSTHARKVAQADRAGIVDGARREEDEVANDDEEDEDMRSGSEHEERPRPTPATSAIKQSRSSPVYKFEPPLYPAKDVEDEDEGERGTHEWPDNFPPPPSPDLPPARYRAASERTQTPGIKNEFSPAIKREPGSERVFSPVFVKREAKAEYQTPGPAAKVATKTTRGSLRRKRAREEMEAAAAEVQEEPRSLADADPGRRGLVAEAESETRLVVLEEPESDPRRFDREGKKRRVSPTQAQDRSHPRTEVRLPSQEIRGEAHTEDATMEGEHDVEAAAASEGDVADADDSFRLLAPGERLPLLGGFVPDFRVTYGIDEGFMLGVREAIEGLRKKAARKLERA